MKRVLIFLLPGPTMIVTAWLIFIAAIDGSRGSVDVVATVLFVSTFFVAAITRPIDGHLAHACPIFWRAPPIVVAGATIAVGIPLVLFAISPFVLLSILSSMAPQWVVVPLAIGGFTGVCSLLSHNYRVKAANPASSHRSLS